MKTFNSVDDAYQEIARSCIDFVRGRAWDQVTCHATIYSKMARSHTSLSINGNVTTDALDWPDSSIDVGAAILFLRDSLFKSTGDRIWGLKFTFYPTGKFEIEYDYNKPEGYEENSKTISGQEISTSLTKMNIKK